MVGLETLLTGLGAGVAYALTGYGKKQGQAFDWKKFGRTCLIGLLTGVTIIVTGWEPAQGHAFLVQAGAVPLVENTLKIVWEKALPWMRGLFAD